MKFSLILPTLNRPQYVVECLNSLDKQNFNDFEVIIIDQSEDNYTEEKIKKINLKFNITYKRVNFKGLSKARNYALKFCCGEYICLLDDDARYEENYLGEAYNILEKYKNEKLIISGKIIDDIKNEDFIDYSCIDNEELFRDSRIFKVCLSAALIINKNLVINAGSFDENFGVGAFFGAAEESDLILRLLENGSEVIHCKNMIAYHLKPDLSYNLDVENKIYNYALGGGALFKKHIIYRKKIKYIPRYLRSLIVPTIKIILNLNNKTYVKRNMKILQGHIYGFIKFNLNYERK